MKSAPGAVHYTGLVDFVCLGHAVAKACITDLGSDADDTEEFEGTDLADGLAVLHILFVLVQANLFAGGECFRICLTAGTGSSLFAGGCIS